MRSHVSYCIGPTTSRRSLDSRTSSINFAGFFHDESRRSRYNRQSQHLFLTSPSSGWCVRARYYSRGGLLFGGHAEIPLHLGLVDAVDGDPGEVAADDERPHGVPHARVRIETAADTEWSHQSHIGSRIPPPTLEAYVRHMTKINRKKYFKRRKLMRERYSGGKGETYIHWFRRCRKKTRWAMNSPSPPRVAV